MFKKIAKNLQELKEDWQIYWALCHSDEPRARESKFSKKWNAFVARWAEYKALRKKYMDAGHDVKSAYYTISSWPEKGGDSNTCVKRFIELDVSTRDLMVVENYCRHYKLETVCNVTDCPCYKRYQEYRMALAAHSAAKEKLRAFWKGGKTK